MPASLFYSPCTVTMNNQNNFTGQALGNTVNITNHFTLSYRPVLVPGVPSLDGLRPEHRVPARGRVGERLPRRLG